MKNEVPGGEPITMPTVTIEEGQKKLSELIHRLTPGEEVVITENDQPVARLVATAPPQCKPRQLVLELRFLTPPDQIAARYSLGCDCRSCLASTFRPVGVSIFSASSFSSRCSAS